MTKIEQLRQQCKDAKGGWFVALTPEQVLELINLIELQHRALREYTSVCRRHYEPNDFTPTVMDEGFYARDAIKAFEEWNKP